MIPTLAQPCIANVGPTLKNHHWAPGPMLVQPCIANVRPPLKNRRWANEINRLLSRVYIMIIYARNVHACVVHDCILFQVTHNDMYTNCIYMKNISYMTWGQHGHASKFKLNVDQK